MCVEWVRRSRKLKVLVQDFREIPRIVRGLFISRKSLGVELCSSAVFAPFSSSFLQDFGGEGRVSVQLWFRAKAGFVDLSHWKTVCVWWLAGHSSCTVGVCIRWRLVGRRVDVCVRWLAGHRSCIVSVCIRWRRVGRRVDLCCVTTGTQFLLACIFAGG
ncbi:hypothetical protein BaRGS_00025767 [Batillaria attramentaria]|uniref:Uncharacterized protein n=1 Tax=Batillaria attramentaria TaxID=370345 RepID=A0ABD0JD66_9CAEN